MTGAPAAPSFRVPRWIAPCLLLGILLLAALLRFAGLGWGLRHTPHIDERYFVENVGWMRTRGDLDHRFYEYPGLFFYLLAPLLWNSGPPPQGADAYLAARGLVAAFGVASVALAYLLGSRLLGRSAGLCAALLLAVCPVEVQTAHMVRPDVVLEAFVLLGFLLLQRVGPRLSGDLGAGAAVGLATAIKFSGVLLAPAYVVKRLATAGPRWQRLALAGTISILVFALCSPYSFLNPEAFERGLRNQVGYHYVERERGAQAFLGMAYTYLLILRKALGSAALLAVTLGSLLALRDWRRFLPLVVFPLTTIGVFSTAEVHHDRFLVPTLGVLGVLAGVLVQRLRRRSLGAAAALTGLLATPPLLTSLDYVHGIRQPTGADLALDWIQANTVAGARIVTSLPEIGFDRSRLEVLGVRRIDAGTLPQALAADLVVAGPGDDEAVLARLQLLLRAEAATRHGAPPVFLMRAPPASRPQLVALPLRPEWLAVSEAADQVSLLVDSDRDSAWVARGAGAWIAAAFPQLQRVARVELAASLRARAIEPALRLQTSADGELWTDVATLPGRPPLLAQVAAPGPSQVLLVADPQPVRRLRVVRVGQRERPWRVGALRVDVAP